MKTFRKLALIAAIAIIGFHIYSLDFQDLRFQTNRTHYLGIFAMLLGALSFLLGIVKGKKNKKG